MIKSMTAYGRGEYRLGNTQFVAEIRSVNNRYRDIILKFPKNYQIFEKDLKEIISSRVRRARFNGDKCSIRSAISLIPFLFLTDVPIFR